MSRNAHKTGLSGNEIWPRFWPATQTALRTAAELGKMFIDMKEDYAVRIRELLAAKLGAAAAQ